MQSLAFKTSGGCNPWYLALQVAVFIALAWPAFGQIQVGAPSAAPAGPGAESVSVMVGSGSSQFIPALMTGATNNFIGGPLSITMTWTSLHPGRTAVSLYGYFNDANSALSHTSAGNTLNIPSGAVKARVNGVGAYNPFSSVVPFTGNASGQLLVTQAISGTTKSGSRTDTFELQIDLTGIVNGQDMTQLPPDTYVGTLHLQVQVAP